MHWGWVICSQYGCYRLTNHQIHNLIYSTQYEKGCKPKQTNLKEDGGGREGDVPAPKAELVGGTLRPICQKPIKKGEASGSLLVVRMLISPYDYQYLLYHKYRY